MFILRTFFFAARDNKIPQMYINQPCITFKHLAVKAQSNISLKIKTDIGSCVIVLQLISVP